MANIPTKANLADISDNSVDTADITDAAVTVAKIQAVDAGEILVGNAGGTAVAAVALSGDATLAATGALTIANDAVETAMVNAGAITGAKLGTGFIKMYRATGASAIGFLVLSGSTAPTASERVIDVRPQAWASATGYADQYVVSSSSGAFSPNLSAAGHLYQSAAFVGANRLIVTTHIASA